MSKAVFTKWWYRKGLRVCSYRGEGRRCFSSLQLCSTAHPYLRTVSGSLQSDEGTEDAAPSGRGVCLGSRCPAARLL